MDALGTPTTLALFGGTSEIGLAIVSAYVDRGLRNVVLAARPGERRDAASAGLRGRGVEVRAVDFDAADPDSHPALVGDVFSGDIDIAVIAAGVLDDDPEASWRDHDRLMRQVAVNFTGGVSIAALVADRLSDQGHGVLVALSSVAGERVRRSNFAYGATKAGFDGFCLGLGEALRGSGARVLVVRPGFVRTAMTAGRDEAPLSVDAADVAAAVVQGIDAGRDLIWVPGPMRGVMSALRHVPRPVFRKLPI